jgi:hypothetical protein
MLGPGGEVGRGVAVSVHHESTGIAVKDPLGQRHPLSEPSTLRAGPARREPAVANDQLRAKPFGFVGELTCELRPCGVRDSAGKAVVAVEIVDGEILDGQPGVVLDQLTRDFMEEILASVGNPDVLATESHCGFGAVVGAAARSGQGTGVIPQLEKPAGERVVRRPSADLGPVRSRGDSEGNKAEIHSDKPGDLGYRQGLMAALRVEVRSTHVEGHLPAGTAPHDGGE